MNLGLLGTREEEEYRNLIMTFPARFEQIQKDWAKFKAGAARGLFTTEERKKILTWYRDFPEWWQTVSPNWVFTETGMIAAHRYEFAKKVEAWIAKLNTEISTVSPQSRFSGIGALGVLPAVVIAGIWIAGAIAGVLGTTAAVIAALAYFQEQTNNSRLIEEVVAGNISEEVLTESYRAESSPGIFDQIGDVAKLGLIAAGIYLFWPEIKSLFQSRRQSA